MAKKTARKKTSKKKARKKASTKKTAKKTARKKASTKKTARKKTRKMSSGKIGNISDFGVSKGGPGYSDYGDFIDNVRKLKKADDAFSIEVPSDIDPNEFQSRLSGAISRAKTRGEVVLPKGHKIVKRTTKDKKLAVICLVRVK